MTNQPQATSGEEQARRLETAVAHMGTLVRQTDNAQRLRQSAGTDEWTVLQTLGHCAEMIPYWLGQCRRIIEAHGEAPPLGRAADDPGRLAGPAHGANADAPALMGEVESEARQGAAYIRALTPAERAKAGQHPRSGPMRVEDIVERFVVSHAEEHERQIRELLAKRG